MSIRIGQKAKVNNTQKNNLRCFPQIDNSPYAEIDHMAVVLVLDGPVVFQHVIEKGQTMDIPYWSVQVVTGKYKGMVGWMAETNSQEQTFW